MAAARSVGSLFIDIEARTARLEADLARTRGILTKLNGTVSTMGRGFSTAFGIAKAAVAAFAGVASVRALGNLALGTMENVRAQMALSEQYGISVNELKVYSEASEFLGVTNLDLGRTFLKLSDMTSKARKGASTELKKMGIDAKEFREALPAQQFEMVIDGLNGISNAADRTVLAQRIFGKEARNIDALLRGGTQTFGEIRDKIEETGQALDHLDLKKIGIAAKAIDELHDTWEGFKMKLTVALTPVIYKIATALKTVLADIDVEALVEKIQGFFQTIYNFIMTLPERIQLVFANIKLGIMSMAALLKASPLGAFMGNIAGSAEDAAQRVADLEDEIAGLKAAIAAVSLELTGDFDEAMANTATNIGSIAISVGESWSDFTLLLVDQFADAMAGLGDVMANFFVDGENGFEQFGRNIVKQMISTFAKLSVINPILNAVFGGMMGGTAAGWWEGLATMAGGAGKARGGPVMAGDTHVFGENGPEIGTVARSGYITPNDRIGNYSNGSGGGSTIVINQHFTNGMTRAEFASALPMIMQQTKAAAADGALRGGSYSKAFKT